MLGSSSPFFRAFEQRGAKFVIHLFDNSEHFNAYMRAHHNPHMVAASALHGSPARYLTGRIQQVDHRGEFDARVEAARLTDTHEDTMTEQQQTYHAGRMRPPVRTRPDRSDALLERIAKATEESVALQSEIRSLLKSISSQLAMNARPADQNLPYDAASFDRWLIDRHVNGARVRKLLGNRSASEWMKLNGAGYGECAREILNILRNDPRTNGED